MPVQEPAHRWLGPPPPGLAEKGVLLLPGSVYDEPSHVRVGFGRTNMPDALRLLEACLGEACLGTPSAV